MLNFPSSICSPISLQDGIWLFGLHDLMVETGRVHVRIDAVSSGSLLISTERLSLCALCAGPCCGVRSHLLFGVILALAICPLYEMICLQCALFILTLGLLILLVLSEPLCCHSGNLGFSGSPVSIHGMPWALSQVHASAGLPLSPWFLYFLEEWTWMRGWGGSREKGSWPDLLVPTVFTLFFPPPLSLEVVSFGLSASSMPFRPFIFYLLPQCLVIITGRVGLFGIWKNAM